MADVYVNALTTISTEPTAADSLVAVNRNTNEGKIIDYNKLADVILNKITSKQFSGLTTASKLLTGAINELDSDVSSVNSGISSLGNNLNAALRVYPGARTYTITLIGMSALLVYGCGGAMTPFMFLVSTGTSQTNQVVASDIITNSYYPHTVTKNGDTLTIEFTGGEEVYSGLYVLQLAQAGF